MAKLLLGSDVSAVLNEELRKETIELTNTGIKPTLEIIRVGERDDDISYERGAIKRCDTIGVCVKNVVLPQDISEEKLLDVIKNANNDSSIHGILLFRPLPKHINDESIRSAILPEKDMDGITDGSLSGIFTGTDKGYPPCTAAACMEILKHYNIELKGKKVVVVGRSLVIGKPVAMMLLAEHATVTICHTRTVDMPKCCRDADILVVAAGRAGVVDHNFVRENQIIIDVGININSDGKLCGDVLFEDVEPIVSAITPVPRGVGAVTTSVLVKHVITAARKQMKKI